jgi:hypothetical protein
MRTAIVLLLLTAAGALADGKVFMPAKYNGSLEEQSQEAILIYTPGDGDEEAVEDIILKIGVKGAVDSFAWVIPFPTEPTVEREDASLFAELFNYVQSRRADRATKYEGSKDKAKDGVTLEKKPVEVLSRKTVGSYDVAIVRENEAGALNRWLKEEGFQGLGDDAEDTLRFYREKKAVFACVKVKDAQPDERKYIELHPLRFSFKTGRDEGIYFPMKLTGLQNDLFAINLYVFHRYWIDGHQSDKGYEHRGFRLDHRDWDSPDCKANAGKTYSAPETDPFLKSKANLLPEVTRLFQKLHPGKHYYMTKITGVFRPEDVRIWSDDLWLETYRVSAVGQVGQAQPWIWAGIGVVVIVLAVGGWMWWRTSQALTIAG